MKQWLLFLLLFSLPAFAADDPFERAAKEFHVPVNILRTIAKLETGSRHIVVKGDDGEHAPLYGIMGLRDDDWFGHSLRSAADLLGLPPVILIASEEQNIRGAAAYLSSLSKGIKSSDPYAWAPALRGYSGIPDSRDKDVYIREFYTAMLSFDKSIDPDLLVPQGVIEPAPKLGTQDYPSAEWDPSPNFTSGAIRPQYIVVHVTEGNYASSLSWLKSPLSSASSHYIIRSRDGHISQLVHDNDRAWHARCWNPYAVGVEHEGFVMNSDYFTEALYTASAALTKFLAGKFMIPMDELHVIGHNFWSTPMFPASPLYKLGPCNDHTDPGPFWNWSLYFQLLH